MVSTADWDQGGRNCSVQADLLKQGSWSIIFTSVWTTLIAMAPVL